MEEPWVELCFGDSIDPRGRRREEGSARDFGIGGEDRRAAVCSGNPGNNKSVSRGGTMAATISTVDTNLN